MLSNLKLEFEWFKKNCVAMYKMSSQQVCFADYYAYWKIRFRKEIEWLTKKEQYQSK